MKSVIALLSLVCFITSCNSSNNHNPDYVSDSPEYRMLMKRLEELTIDQPQKNVIILNNRQL